MLVSFRFKQFTEDMEEVDRLRTVKHNFILGIIIRRFKTVLESTHHIVCDSICTMGPTEKSKAKALEHTFEIDGADYKGLFNTMRMIMRFDLVKDTILKELQETSFSFDMNLNTNRLSADYKLIAKNLDKDHISVFVENVVYSDVCENVIIPQYVATVGSDIK